MKNQKGTGFAVLCDSNGKIKSVLYQGLNNKYINQDSLLLDYIDFSSREKYINFQIALTVNKTIADWQLNIFYENHVRSVLLAGTISEDGMVIVFGYSLIEIIEICKKLELVNVKGVDNISRLINDNQNSKTVELRNIDSMYDELSSVNNELVSLQRELAKKNVELDQLVKERTAQLESANLELEAFLYSVSHQLRSPLRGINGWSQALSEEYKDKLDQTGIKYLERVQNEAIHMGRLIEDFQLFSKISRKELKVELIDLTNLAQQTMFKLEKKHSGRKVEFICQSGLQDLGDKELLEIVLENLFSNAYKFTKSTKKAVIEFGKTISKDSPTFFVKDNGVGFNVELAKNLFGAYFQPHDPIDFPGKGIGLAIVKRIIHKHNGQIWAEAKVNEGAIFYFTLIAKKNI
jgi:signal transduction histidine kinase